MKHFISINFFLLFLIACNRDTHAFDASGTFEANEVIVSSEIPGKLLSFNVEEGDIISKDSVIAIIDALPLQLQKAQVEASIKALDEKTTNAAPRIQLLKDQLAMQQIQLEDIQRDQQRTERLVNEGALTKKQLDDVNTKQSVLQKQIDITNQQIKVQLSDIATQNRSVLSERNPLKKSAAQIEEQVKRTQVINPVKGTVMTKYAMAGEITSTGKALYKIADLDTLLLRAYITGVQLPQVKLGQQVTVAVDDGATKYKNYTGTIEWIADKAEFTPKTIQTKEERANLVYAIKIRVKNDGYLKIGMYGEVNFK